MKENEGKLSFTKKTPANLKEINGIVEERNKKEEEKLKHGSKDDTLLSSDEEMSTADEENRKNIDKTLKKIKDMPDDAEADSDDSKEVGVSEDDQNFNEETLLEKQALNKKTKGLL